ncbi:MAG TPA: M1 family aminopeptidase [Terriglobales bacterium]
MTEVIGRAGKWTIALVLWAALAVARAAGQAQTPMPSTAEIAPGGQTSRHAEQLYLQLRSAGLDPAKTFHIREASITHDRLHVTLADGTIAFTQDVYGRVTGAFFEGEGEILLIPPDQAERSSMALFTGAAVLEEQFSTAYFRFNDDTYRDLEPDLRPAEEGAEFASKWNSTALNLAEWDALRLFVTFSKYLPAEGEVENAGMSSDDRFLHARVQGAKLGAFDVYYDSTANEPIVAAQQKMVDGANYYNVWTAFRPPPSGAGRGQPKTMLDEIAMPAYHIDAEVMPPTRLRADTRAQIEVLQGGARALLFELSRYLRVSEVKLNGRPLETIQNQALEGSQLARRGNDILAVVFPRRLKTGEKFELEFSYQGDVLSEAGGGLLYVGARGIWYPNRGLAAADFDLQFRYPDGWTLLATGKRAASEEASRPFPVRAGEQVSRWTTERSIPIAGFNLGRYEKATARAGDVVVETYAAGVERAFPVEKQTVVTVPNPRPGRPDVPIITPVIPPSPVRNVQNVADKAARAIQFYAERFGPYPYGNLELTQMPGPLSQGWPGLVFLSSFAFLTSDEKVRLHMDPVDAILDDQVTAHETAHQWWGDLVYWRSYRDQWMAEGLANYCSLMILEKENPVAFQSIMEKYRVALTRKNKQGVLLREAGPVTLGSRLSSSEFPDGYEAISYGRGTWLFHMLRHMLNDGAAASPRPGSVGAESDSREPFIRALLKVRERYAGHPITTRELIEILAEELPPALRYEGKPSLEWFYEGWINGLAMPRLELQEVKLTPKAGSVAVSGTIVQKDSADDLVTSVPLYAVMPRDRRVFLGRVFADGSQSSFHLVAPAGVRRIVVDPEQTILTAPR